MTIVIESGGASSTPVRVQGVLDNGAADEFGHEDLSDKARQDVGAGTAPCPLPTSASSFALRRDQPTEHSRILERFRRRFVYPFFRRTLRAEQ